MENSVKSFFKLSETITCSICKQDIVLYEPAKSEYIVCPSCFSYLHIFTRAETRLNRKLDQPDKVLVLKLGSTGNIHGTEFKVIAYLEKKEAGTDYHWREYILTSHDKGYVTLSEFDGHWNFIASKDFLPDYKEPISYGLSIGYKDVEYKLFNRYTPVVTAMLGEVDWDVVNEKVKATEYIAPPFMVVKEVGKTSHQTDYYIGEYLDAEVIANAFNIDKNDLPSRLGLVQTNHQRLLTGGQPH